MSENIEERVVTLEFDEICCICENGTTYIEKKEEGRKEYFICFILLKNGEPFKRNRHHDCYSTVCYRCKNRIEKLEIGVEFGQPAPKWSVVGGIGRRKTIAIVDYQSLVDYINKYGNQFVDDVTERYQHLIEETRFLQ